MRNRVQAVARCRLPVTTEQVFDAWLTPDLARVWLAAALKSMGLEGDIRSVEMDARAGGRFVLSDQRGDLEARHWGTYLELDRPRRIVFTWITDASQEADPCTVTLTIEPDGPGSVATIVHEMAAEWKEYVPRVESGWSSMLQAIGSTLTGDRPVPK